MPRARLTARGCTAAAVFATAVCATAAVAAPPGAIRRPPQAATAAGARPGEVESRRRDEIDALQRQDVADAHKRRFNIDVDWRTTSLDRLVDVRARAAKAADLQQRLGVSVDWQRYSWIELEALRRTLLNFERYRGEHAGDPQAGPATTPPSGPSPAHGPPQALGAAPAPRLQGHDEDGLVAPTFKARPLAKGARTVDPDGIIQPTFAGRSAVPAAARDPDGVIRPTFMLRSRWLANDADPDGLIAPTFVPYRRASRLADADDLIDPMGGPMGPMGGEDVRPVPARW